MTVIDAVRSRVARVRRLVARATPLPMLVRGGVGLCLLTAMTVAWPATLVVGRYLPLLALVALYPTVAPRGRGTTVAALVVVAGWLVDTTGFGAPVTLWRVLTIATLLYLAHTLASLAAALPYDAVVATQVPAAWLGRALVVVLVSAVLTVVALGLGTALAGPAFLLATMVGLTAAAAVTLLLARLLRRP